MTIAVDTHSQQMLQPPLSQPMRQPQLNPRMLQPHLSQQHLVWDIVPTIQPCNVPLLMIAMVVRLTELVCSSFVVAVVTMIVPTRTTIYVGRTTRRKNNYTIIVPNQNAMMGRVVKHVVIVHPLIQNVIRIIHRHV